MFVNVLPQFIAILLFTGLILAVLSPETIRHVLGDETALRECSFPHFWVQSTLVPVMIAFPIVAELLKSGAGIAQMAVFISTLTTVGLITIPIEIKYLGKKTAILRNVLSFLFSFVAAYFMGGLLA